MNTTPISNQHVNPVIDFQPPPFTFLKERFEYGNTHVRIAHINGSELEGKLLKFDISEEILQVLDPESEQCREFSIAELKSILLLTPYFIADPDENAPGKVQQLSIEENSRPFHINFNDGSEKSGITIGSRIDKLGIHFYEYRKENNSEYEHQCFHFFTPKSSIVDYEIGDKIGSVLVNQNNISEGDLSSALTDLHSKKKAKIGEYLLSNQVVDTKALELSLERQKSMPNLRLGEILLSEDLITESQLDFALKEQKSHVKMPLGELLIGKGLIDRKQLQKSLAKKLGIPLVDLQEYVIDPDLLKQMPVSIVFKYSVIPLDEYEDKLVVAIENPLDWQALDTIRFAVNRNIDAVMASHEDIAWALQFYFSSDDLDHEEISLGDLESEDNSHYDIHEFTKVETSAVTENIVVRIVNKIIIDAYRQKASDVHIEPGVGQNYVMVRFRKDGILSEYYRFPAKYSAAIISRIKVMAHLDISMRFKPQDGKIFFKQFNDLDIELRVATIPTVGNTEDVVIRILATGKSIPITGIGLSIEDLDNTLDLTSKNHGLFLVCGPTGSGKTTTLHSVLGSLNSSEKKIWTAEDPVEITQPGLRQVPVNEKVGLSFAKVMRAFLRADPDIIMIGEIRDTETADIAI